MPSSLLFADAICMDHITGPGHPESPARYTAVMEEIARQQRLSKGQVRAPTAATEEQLARVHTETYIRQVQEEVEQGLSSLTTGDTAICPRSYEVATFAAGAMIDSVNAVMQGEAKRTLSVMRPPGHHASSDRGMGFCLFNNVAIAARHAQAVYGVERVLIVDWDVHHGNGTQDIFYHDESVFYFSTHQWPLYPGTGSRTEVGAGKGEGYTLNVPLPAGSGGPEIMAALRDQLVPAMADYRPDLILLSAGFDSRIDDPLGSFRLDDDDFAACTRVIMELADTYSEGRLLSALEGGYNLAGLASATSAHLAELQGVYSARA